MDFSSKIFLNTFVHQLLARFFRRINFLKNMFKEIVAGGTQKPTPRAIKNMRNRQISRSRCVLKKSLLEKSICEQSYQHPKVSEKRSFFCTKQPFQLIYETNFLVFLFSSGPSFPCHSFDTWKQEFDWTRPWRHTKVQLNSDNGVLTSSSKITTKSRLGQVALKKRQDPIQKWTQLNTALEQRLFRFQIFTTYRVFDAVTGKFALERVEVPFTAEEYWTLTITFVSRT